MKKTDIVSSAMRYRRIIILITGMLILFGIFGLYNMPKQEFPSYTIREGMIVGVFPGANVRQVDEQLSKPLEKFLFSYKEIDRKKTYAQSKDGIVYLFVSLNDNVNNKDEVWSKLKHGLNELKNSLPAGVLSIIVNDDFGETSATVLTIESKTKTYRQLQKYLDNLEAKLRKVDMIANLHSYGMQKEQIGIYLDKDKMAAYGITMDMLGKNLFMHGLITSGGTLKTGKIEMPVHVNKYYRSEQDIEQQIVNIDSQGNIVRMKDIAKIVREYADPDSYITNNGVKSLLLSIEMRNGNDITAYGKRVNHIIDRFQKTLPEDVKISSITDQAKVVSDSVDRFLWEMLIAIASVIMVTMILMPFRVAAVAATSIPITIFISLGIMYAIGIELNTVTLAGLIIVLGLIVDDCIVIVDGYIDEIDKGMSRWHAAIASARVYFKSLVTATLSISITFFPLLLSFTGALRDFIKSFPWTIAITLFVSLAVAMLIIPFLQYSFIKKGLSKEQVSDGKISLLERFQLFYDKIIPALFKHPYPVLFAGLSSVIIAFVLFGRVEQRLMPYAERDQFVVEFYLPEGTPLKKTAQVCDSMEHILRKDKRTVSVTSFIGTGSPRFQSSFSPHIPEKNFAQFIVNTKSNDATVAMLDQYTDRYAEYFPEAYVSFKQIDNEDATVAIEARMTDEDMNIARIFADSLVRRMKSIKGVAWIRTDNEGNLPYANIKMDPVKSNQLGIDKTTLSSNVANSLDGLNITKLWEGDYSLDVKLKPEWKDHLSTVEQLQNEYIPTGTGSFVLLRQIATISPDWEYGEVVRRNGDLTVSVLVNLKRGINENDLFPKVENAVHLLQNRKEFRSVSISYGGVKESDDKTIPQLGAGLLIALLIIFFILIFHYKKVSLSLLTIFSIPLCFFGAAAGLIIMKMQLSITAILGIVCLFGIVVRNTVILFDYAENLRIKEKTGAKKAAMEAGKRRLRPIFLTSAAASMGVIPMILSRSPLWSPMGAVICFGTLFSMIFITTILPIAYWLVFRKTSLKRIPK